MIKQTIQKAFTSIQGQNNSSHIKYVKKNITTNKTVSLQGFQARGNLVFPQVRSTYEVLQSRVS